MNFVTDSVSRSNKSHRRTDLSAVRSSLYGMVPGYNNNIKKVKQSRYRPGVAQRVPGS
jgi:hypothetical protein